MRAAEARADFRARVEESAARVAALKAACRVRAARARGDAAVAARHAGPPGAGGSFGAAPPSAAGSSPVAEGRDRSQTVFTPMASPSPVGSGVARNRPLRASFSCTACIARIEAARSPAGVSCRWPNRKALSSRTMPPGAQVVGRPVEVARISLLVGVDEDEIVRPARDQARQHLQRRADVNRRARAEAGAAEALARHLGVARLAVDGVRASPVARQAAQDRDAGVAAQRADLDGASRAGGAGQHLQVARVERRDLDVGQPGGGAAGADLGQDLVLGRVDPLEPLGDAARRRYRSSCSCPDPAASKPQGQQRLQQHERDGGGAERVPAARAGGAAPRRPSRTPRARSGRLSSGRRAGSDSRGSRLTTKAASGRSLIVPSPRAARTR